MSLLKLMANRYTCRRYSTENIREEDLKKILEAARVAPTSHNNQPQRIYVLQSEEAKEKLMKDFAYNYKAPCYLVCTYDTNEVWRNDLNENRESGEIDVSIVMTHMLLMIEELGLGACWIGHINPEIVRKNLELPESEKVVAILSLGYHREDDRPSKLHDIRKMQEEIVRYL